VKYSNPSFFFVPLPMALNSFGFEDDRVEVLEVTQKQYRKCRKWRPWLFRKIEKGKYLIKAATNPYHDKVMKVVNGV